MTLQVIAILSYQVKMLRRFHQHQESADSTAGTSRKLDKLDWPWRYPVSTAGDLSAAFQEAASTPRFSTAHDIDAVSERETGLLASTQHESVCDARREVLAAPALYLCSLQARF